MATVSEVKTGLDDIAGVMSMASSGKNSVISQLQGILSDMNAMPGAYQDVRDTVAAYVPTGAFETVAQSELTSLELEWVSSKAEITAALTALGA